MGDHPAQDTLTQAEREHLATYVAGPSTAPGWFYPVVGLLAGAAVASNDVENWPVAVIGALVAVFATGALIGTIVVRSRVVPRIGGMPAPLRNIVMAFWLVAAVVFGVSLTWAFVAERGLAFTIAGILIAVTIGVGGWVTERTYARRAGVLAAEAGLYP